MGDITKFEQFMRNYQDMVYSVAVRLLASDADAQDVSQTVFLKAYENFATLDGNPSAGGWAVRAGGSEQVRHEPGGD